MVLPAASASNTMTSSNAIRKQAGVPDHRLELEEWGRRALAYRWTPDKHLT